MHDIRLSLNPACGIPQSLTWQISKSLNVFILSAGRDGSGIARNAANSDRLGSSYAQNQSYQKEDLMADDNFAPSHDPEQQRLDDEQQVSRKSPAQTDSS